MAAVVVGIDLGTTHVKFLAVDALGRPAFERQENIAPHLVEETAVFEQDPELVAAIVLHGLKAIAASYSIAGIAFSAGMHSFLVVDEHDRPVTASWTWLDRRAAAIAQMLRSHPIGRRWHQITGTPVHAMSPAVKWLYFRDHYAGSLDNLRVVALKDFVLHRLTGQWATDFSTASASGLCLTSGQWSEEVCEYIGLPAAALPKIMPMDTVEDYHGIPLAWGGSDGAMAYIALDFGQDTDYGVLSAGTSGTLRLTIAHLPDILPDHAFGYYMGSRYGYLFGEAFSNVGSLMAWLGGIFGWAPDVLIRQGLDRLDHTD
ncbi:MAG: FGGY family carbohydrate kinase, partial [Firmicutes bacterium]|nr:FGGY family carbohydrate kinase [Bacillota bacterium]